MRPRWALAPLAALALLAYGQVVSSAGLLVFVAPAAILGWAVGTGVRVVAPGLVGAVAVWPGLALTVAAWAGLAELLAGDASGPVTRASLLAGGLCGAMAVLVRTRYPSAALVPAVAWFASAIALGAVDGLLGLTGLFAVAAGWLLLVAGPYRLGDLRQRRRAVPVAAVLLLAGLTAIAGTTLASTALDAPWTIPGAEQNRAPTAIPSDEAAPEPTPTPSPSPSVDPSEAAVATEDAFEEIGSSVVDALTSTVLPALRTVALALLLLLALWIVVSLAWRLWVTVRWARLRRHLAAGGDRDRVVGAWAWARLRLDQAGHVLPAAASPDVVAEGLPLPRLPETVTRDLRRLAAIAARAGYAPSDGAPGRVDRHDAVRAWSLAREVESRLRATRRPRQWWTDPARRPDADLLGESRPVEVS